MSHQQTPHRPHFKRQASGPWQASPRQAPLTFALILLAALLSWAVDFGHHPARAFLLITDSRAYDVTAIAERWSLLMDLIASGAIWRPFAPILLHLSVQHLIFNAALLWFLGSQIEVLDGRRRLIWLLFVSSLSGNILQYLLYGPFFGGLSGVVYAALGYCWLMNQRLVHHQSAPAFAFPAALMLFSLIWLLLGLSGAAVWLGLGAMANAAHFGGLLSGLLLALLVPLHKPDRPMP